MTEQAETFPQTAKLTLTLEFRFDDAEQKSAYLNADGSVSHAFIADTLDSFIDYAGEALISVNDLTYEQLKAELGATAMI